MPRLVQVLPLLLAAGLAAAPPALAAGFENFNNFITNASYTSGTFLGQDGSIWTYVQCRGDQIITAPRTPTLARNSTPPASIVSGTLSNGCGALSFDWMRPFASVCNFDILINGVVRHTVTGGVTDMTNHVDSLVIEEGGNFTLAFRQHDVSAGQVSIDNIAWTSFGAAPPEPPAINFAPDTNGVLTAYGNAIGLDVTANEPNTDTVTLWATGLPAGAVFPATNGLAPLLATFSWTPVESQTGSYSVAFYAGDKDGTNSRSFAIEVTPIYPYYHYAEGLTGAVLKAKLHEIISTGAIELDSSGEDAAMKAIHTDPANSSNVLLLYNPTSSLPKTAYNNSPNGWNKEHCWPESRGLGNQGPDQVDVHNLYAEHIGVNALRGNLYFDESNTNDAVLYRSPATNIAPETSMDSNSWEPPPASKGNVARAVFYMATRYDGGEADTAALSFSDNPAHTNTMGILTNLLLWHALDPPDDWESNRNELIYSNYQSNRNPFVDRPEWAESIWGTDSDGDAVNDTYELIAGSGVNNPTSVFAATLSGTQIVCGLLSSGSVWRLYEGTYQGHDIVWRPIAETNRLQGGTLRFNFAPTSPAAFYHLRALRP